jgi:LuxR family transcriptional regulator, maltose regulon positive regulatory protein
MFVGEPYALLATKLHVPRPQAGFVTRSRLTERLDGGLDGKLISVCAPAGAGKTSLLAGWASAGQRPAAWLSLDAGDNDPARFWRHVTAALDRVSPGISERVAPVFGPSAVRTFDHVITALVNELSGRAPTDLALLIMDDYHLIAAEPVHAGVAFLLDSLPPGLRLVIASRSDPPLRLGRLRARRELTEVREADLRFTAAEAGLLLRATAPGLSTSAVETLTARTEGWAAGLQLAGLSVAGQPDGEAFVAAFGGSHRYVLDYLAEEVLDRLDAPVLEFLLETSVLDRLSGPLCDAVTGHPGGQAMLERIERAGLFLIPLDEVRGWWRYHHLFRDLLSARLLSSPLGSPGRMSGLHRAAASWHAERGLADDAVRHAYAAGLPELAGTLIERYFDEVYFTGENATLLRWLDGLPEELGRKRTRLSLIRAYMAVTSGDLEAAEAALADLAALPGWDEGFRSSAGPEASLITNVGAATAIARAWVSYLRGDTTRLGEFAAEARAQLRDDEWLLRSLYQLNLALADWISGRLGDAGQCFTHAIDTWRSAGQRALAAQGWFFLAEIRRFQGDLDAAMDAYRELARETELPSGGSSPVAGIGHVGMARLLYQRGDLDAARSSLAIGLPLCRQLSDTQALASGLALLGWIRQASGDPAGARDAMAEALRAGPSPAIADLLNPVPAQRARLLLAQGSTDAAVRWAREKGLSAEDEPAYTREPDYLTLARLLIATGQPGAALALLDRLLARALDQGRGGSVIEIRVLRALSLAGAGDLPGAVAELTEALALAARQRYIRVFADEGAALARLLGDVMAAYRAGEGTARRVPLDYLAAVARACAPASSASPEGHVAGLAEALTPRELQVLELIAAGAPNQRIADDLVVTLDTVKKHITHVLGKLSVGNRTEAVARARAIGLLS